ncbi:MAG TPA: putative 4-mercaptohistidine N1-methyltransferase [Chthoniobacterales bacterium]|nr:putative 4-mercaptohistidine N1-methyltransferase [Chthoniobacterales bacterium]
MSGNIYESPRLVAEYLLMHYGGAEDVLGEMPGPAGAVGFATRLVRELLAPCPADARALDLGCAVGASSFELARSCREVIGIDFSHAFIRAAETLAENGAHPYEKTVEGTLTEAAIARIPEDIDRSQTNFRQGDAQNLPGDLGQFDVVLGANLLCRLPTPMRLIDRLPSLVKTGGQLLLTTPFTWLEEFTPQARWIGGTPATGRSFEALQALLTPHVELEHKADIPFLIREHARKFQYSVSCGSRWRRR